MLLAIAIPDTLWTNLVFVLVVGVVVTFLTQKWIEKRERRDRRDDRRLQLYLEVVDLVLDNEAALAERGAEGGIAPVELQSKRLRISHRLKLLGSQPVQDAYSAYRHLVFQETAHAVSDRPKNPDDVVCARDALIELMAKDMQST